MPKSEETWDAWEKELAPSVELLAAYQGRRGPPIPWSEYRRRYLREMAAQTDRIDALAQRVAAGETVTLLCASACVDPRRCHRTLLAGLIEAAVAAGRRVSRRRTGRAAPRSGA